MQDYSGGDGMNARRARTHKGSDLLFLTSVIGHVQFIGSLTIKPELRRVTKKCSQANCRISSDAATSRNNRLYTTLRHSRGQGKLSPGLKAIGLRKSSERISPGCTGGIRSNMVPPSGNQQFQLHKRVHHAKRNRCAIGCLSECCIAPCGPLSGLRAGWPVESRDPEDR